MDVLLMAPFPPAVGGIAAWASGIVKVAERTDIIIHILNEAEKEQGEKNFFANIVRSFKIWYTLRDTLENNDSIEIVHINIPANVMSMLRECISIAIVHHKSKKVVLHFHCTLPTAINGKIKYLIFDFICKKSDHIITLNNKSYKYIQNKYYKKVSVLPNFASEDKLEKGMLKYSNDKINKVLFVGNVIAEKGCLDLIEIAKKFPEIEFRFVGRVGNELLGMGKPINVTFTGVKGGTELEEEFLSADIFAFLSYMPMEGFSVALTEAMAYGLPCLVTDWAANKDMIENDGGIVINIKNPEEGILALNKMQDKETRRRQSAWNCNKVENNYTLKAVWTRLMTLYLSLN